MKIKDEKSFILTLALITALVEVTQAFKLNYLPSIQVDEKRFLASVKKVEKEDAKLFGPSNKQPQAQSRIFSQENEKKRKIEDEIEYSIGVRGNDYRLRFKRNDKLIPSPGFSVTWRSKNGDVKEYDIPEEFAKCHYIHENRRSVAALSDCGSGNIRGFVSTKEETFEIEPLTRELQSLFLRDPASFGITEDVAQSIIVEDMYLVKEAEIPKILPDYDSLPMPEEDEDEITFEFENITKQSKRIHFNDEEVTEENLIRSNNRNTVELAVFVDAAAYKTMDKVFNGDEKEIVHTVLATVNQLNGIYHSPSLGENAVDFSLVKLEIHEETPEEIDTFDGEGANFLDSFCKYANRINNKDDDSVLHWDMAVYLTGLDLFHSKWNYPEFDTLGLARNGAMCHSRYSCLISEFGARSNKTGDPASSTGFGAVYVLAHETGHLFGMNHDGSGSANSCPVNGFIMSASKDSEGGETKWSQCSNDILANPKARVTKCLKDKPGQIPLHLDFETEFEGTLPGAVYDAKKQCELFLIDETAFAINSENNGVCGNLICGRKNAVATVRNNLVALQELLKKRVFKAGPALDGTECPQGHCIEGECVPRQQLFRDNLQVEEGGPCLSGCLKRSKGWRSVVRKTTFSIQEWNVLCDDSRVCGDRISREEYAEGVCPRGHRGLPALFSVTDVGKACQIFCKKRDAGWRSRWRPAPPASDGKPAAFPDGTWCFREGSEDFYCQNGQCLPLQNQDTQIEI